MIAGHMLRKKELFHNAVLFTHSMIIHDIEQNGRCFC